MRLLFLWALGVLNAFVGFSQDTLFYHSGKTEVVNVLERRRDLVEYKSLDTNDMGVYKKSFKVIDKVTFGENSKFSGTYDLRNPEPETMDNDSGKLPSEITRFNRVGIELFDLISPNVTFYYQRTFPKAKYLTLGIPISFSPGAVFYKNYQSSASYYTYRRNGYYSNQKLFSSGIEVMSYPNHLIFGAASDFGIVRNRFLFDNYDGTQETRDLDSPFFGMFVRLGYDLNINEYLGFSFYGNIGFSRYVWYYIYHDFYANNTVVEKYNNIVLDGRLNIRFYYSF